jgi:hypothetical protein
MVLSWVLDPSFGSTWGLRRRGRFKLRENAYFAYHGNSRPTWHSGKRDYAALAPSQWTDPQGSGWQGEMVRVPQRLKDWRRLDWREFASVPA